MGALSPARWEVLVMGRQIVSVLSEVAELGIFFAAAAALGAGLLALR